MAIDMSRSLDKIFDWSLISKCRSSLMGIAILFIFLFHWGYPFTDFYLIKYGWLGVDVFFFLSSFGLSYSLSKSESNLSKGEWLYNFYVGRIIRIVPTWWFVIALNCILAIVYPSYVTIRYGLPCNIWRWFGLFSGVGYWIGWNFFEWYVPTLLAFYLFMPLLHKLNRKCTMILLALTIAAVLFLNNSPHQTKSVVSYVINRLPIFIMGASFYKALHSSKSETCNISNDTYMNIVYTLCFITGLLTWIFVPEKIGYNIPISIKFCLMAPIVLLIFSHLTNLFRLNNILSFFGGISLEIYLLHIYWCDRFILHEGVSKCEFLFIAIGFFTVVIILSKLLSITMRPVSKWLKSRLQK